MAKKKTFQEMIAKLNPTDGVQALTNKLQPLVCNTVGVSKPNGLLTLTLTRAPQKTYAKVVRLIGATTRIYVRVDGTTDPHIEQGLVTTTWVIHQQL